VMSDGGIVHLENGFSAEVRASLRSMGHKLGDSDGSFGGYQAILWDEEQGVYYGASEVRKDGQAAGYSGKGMTPGELGFVLQDRAELFALDENHANVVEGGKRPFHTIIPAFVMKDGKPLMSFGVMGGSMQPQGHAQIIVNMIDFGMNLQEAGDAARINHTGSSQPTGSVMSDGGIVHLENGFSAEV